MSTSTFTGRVVGTPTVHHVTGFGNAAKQFIVVTEDGQDARVLVTAGNASIGYTIGNSDFRNVTHQFHLNARGKVTHAVPLEVPTRTEFARDLKLGDRIVLTSGRVVAVEGISVHSFDNYTELAWETPQGSIEWQPEVASDTRWTVMGAAR